MYWSEPLDAAVDAGNATVEFTPPRRAAMFVATVALFAPAAVAVAKRTAKTTAAETWTSGAEKAIGEGVLAA